MTGTKYAPWPAAVVEAVCKVLASTEWPGMTGKEIGGLLAQSHVPDIAPTITKKDRLALALLTRQQQDQAGNCIIRFITEAMAVGRYLDDQAQVGGRVGGVI